MFLAADAASPSSNPKSTNVGEQQPGSWLDYTGQRGPGDCSIRPGEKKWAAQHERRVGREHWQHLLYWLEAKVYAHSSGEETPGTLISGATSVAFSSYTRRHGEGKASKH